MPEPVKHQVSDEDAQRIKEEDFQRAAARRLEMERRHADPDYHPHHDPDVVRLPAPVFVEQVTEMEPPIVISGKAGEIMRHLHPDEPIFIFRAQDVLSVMILRQYAKMIEDYTYGDTSQLRSVVNSANKFAQWQRENPQWVKLPD